MLTDLHLHLDGSLPVETVVRLAKMQDVKLPTYDYEELGKYLTVDKDCKDLNEYLSKFDLPLKLLQTEEALRTAAFDVAKLVNESGVDYAEIRFAPQLHMKNGLSMDQIVTAVLEGIDFYCRENKGFVANVILCMMRGNQNFDLNKETIEVASRFYKKDGGIEKQENYEIFSKVVGIDIAGAEGLFKTESFAGLFRYARELAIPFTIHAGEADGPESMWKAILFGARRIGHGCAAIADEKLMECIKEKGIVIEACPSSNLQTRAVQKLSEHPLKEFLRRGIVVTVNTDNMTVTGTTIRDELEIVKREMNLSDEEINTLIENGEKARFGS